MKTFETRGPVDAARNYVVKRTTELADFIARVQQGRYIVIFAPRQTGKTTFFRWALEALRDEEITYFPIQLDFEEYKNFYPDDFYSYLQKDIYKEIKRVFEKRGETLSDTLNQFLENTKIANHVSMREFFEELAN
ncbi:hypothetical protein F4Y43_17855, partial [Candidatus Poribacteria bacterium]|nr:hypothetical protein [Candidatus Poribacteria bacterium]